MKKAKHDKVSEILENTDVYFSIKISHCIMTSSRIS